MYEDEQLFGEVLFHISDGGVRFAVYDHPKHGAKLKIMASHLGHETNRIELLTTADSLKRLARVLADAAAGEFSGKPYVHCAEIRSAEERDRTVTESQAIRLRMAWRPAVTLG